ncbi:myrosinase 1-like [Nymphalis io]|uniref:myrosinase 1-like n=1 Tax=Inachis io TaxID=171585 RepID=UPI002167C706|nr:myrosinase 1-like [Nymphalis io]
MLFAYQIEGGWNADGKGENIWDRFVHVNPEKIKKNSTGDVSADSYHNWREDVRIAAELAKETFDKTGAKYYNDLINALITEGIEPVITLYHCESPVKIQDMVVSVVKSADEGIRRIPCVNSLTEEGALLQLSQCTDLSFPPNFKFGAATAAYQIEGGWNADGKGENIWDRFVHVNPGKIKNNATGDVSADSYHNWREDVRIAAELGLQFYRFSINWPRILPTGFPNKFNKVGAKYYNDLIDALIAEGIEPVITLYHWELPVKIQDMGGWTNPLIVDWFGNFARLMYSLYADRVKTWLTINEAIVVCDYNYNSGIFAPKIKEPEFAPYICNKYVLLAHAKAYRIFDQEFRPKYSGRISIANNMIWIEPFSSMDRELAELGREHATGRYCHAIFSKSGGWPPAIEKAILKYSLKHGYNESTLPSFTEEEKVFVKGTADFLALNHYTTYMIRSAKPGEDTGYWFLTGSPELNAVIEKPPNAHYGASRILPIYPKGMRRQLAWLKKQYGNIDFLITENGYSSVGNQLDDYDRIHFYKAHLEQVLLSIKVDNVSVIGFAAWSLMDNFEWLDGYHTKFGLYEVDFEDPNRKRTPRASAHFYACVIKNRSLNDTCLNKKLIASRSYQSNARL